MGKTMPIRDVRTSGRRQYPRTEAERGKVSVELRLCDDDDDDSEWW